MRSPLPLTSISSNSQLLTLQIATFGSEEQEGIALGIRSFPVQKLILLCFESDKSKAQELAGRIRDVIGIPITIHIVAKENVVRDTMEKVNEILKVEGIHYQQILMNVSCGEKLIGCAALSAAFINGLKAYGMDSTHTTPLLMPVLKLSYSEIVSEAKINILKAIDSLGGNVESLEKLQQESGYGKPLLSYHVNGSEGTKGLAELGLVEVSRADRGKTNIQITALGTLLVNSKSLSSRSNNITNSVNEGKL